VIDSLSPIGGRQIKDDEESLLSQVLCQRPYVLDPVDKAMCMAHHHCRVARDAEHAQRRFIIIDTADQAAKCMFKNSCSRAERCQVPGYGF